MSDFLEHKKPGIWEHFLREKNGNFAKCKICTTVLKTTGGSTKGLHEHMKRIHSVSVLKRKAVELEPSTSSSVSGPGPMKKFLLTNSEQSLPAVLSRMTACDGLSFHVFVTSTDLRRALLAMGFPKLPNSTAGIKQLVMQHGHQIRQDVMSHLKTKKEQGDRFSITLDEWTSTRNRRYMNINVHAKGGMFWSLGLVRVHGSMPAEKCVSILESKLAEFGLNLKRDIVCICTDGATVMKKVGKLIDAEQQLCYAHGVQLAVLDVLYKRKSQSTTVTTVTSQSVAEADAEATSELSADDDPDNDNDAVEDDRQQLQQGIEVVTDIESCDLIVELSEEYQRVVSKVRAVVKIFKRSPTKNDAILQPYVKIECGKEMSLLFDCRTQWSSLFDMLSRFLQLRSAVQKAMIDLREAVSMQLTDGDFAVIEEIVSALEPVKLAVKALCRRDTDLITAEAGLKFCIIELQKQSSELAKTLAYALENRLAERRALHSGVLQYLHSTNSCDTATEVFSIPTNAAIKKFVHHLFVRLEHSDSTEVTESAQPDNTAVETDDAGAHTSSGPSPTPSPSLEQLMENAMTQTCMATALPSSSCAVAAEKNLAASIKAEMAVFKSTGRRGRCLETVYQYLLTVPPTSVEAERAFSAAGLLCTKLRSRLDDSTVDTLCFLHAHYQAQRA